MSTDADLVLDAIANGARDRAAIAELTGLEVQPVSNHLTALKSKGLIERTDAGWVTTGTTTAPKATVHEGAPPAAAASSPSKPKRDKVDRASKERTEPAPKTRPPRTPQRINGNTRECEFAIAESGAVLFKVTQGPKAGEMGHINHVDAMALYRLMDACDFIRENA